MKRLHNFATEKAPMKTYIQAAPRFLLRPQLLTSV
jgi:hypothetical protein